MDTDNDIARVRDALEAKGLHTWELTEGIINVYSAPVPFDGPDGMDDQYLFTVTVTATP